MNDYLRVTDLNFYYGKQQALYDINLHFPDKKTTALIGPSGSGKSTLLRCFNRIFELNPHQQVTGQILLQEQDLLDRRLDINGLRKSVGMVFQKPTPFPMSIFNNIAFALRLHENLSKQALTKRVQSSLERAALWDEVKDKLYDAGTHLSGGQQQRLCIARAIAIQPKILLLDEPTSSLDPISTTKVESLINDLKTDFTILLVTHHLKQAQRLSDHTVFLKDGEIIEQNTTDNFFSQPQHQQTKDYIWREQ